MGFMAALGSAPASAQDPQLNALYDRIAQLERKVDAMQSGAGSGQAGAASGDIDRRIGDIQQQLRALMSEMQQLNSRLQRLEQGRSGDAGGTGTNRTASAGALTGPSQMRDYGVENLDSLRGSGADGMGGPLDLNTAPGPQVLGTIPQSALERDASRMGHVGSASGPEMSQQGGGYSDGAPATLGDSGSAAAGGSMGMSTGTGTGGGASAMPEAVETSRLDDAASAAAAGPDALYQKSYDSLLQRRYGAAENGFRTFIGEYGSHELAGNAQYWLGETFYARGDYKQAAEAFLKGYRNHGQSPKAPESLFKLGLTLKQLGQSEQACATLKQVGNAYPKATEVVEQAKQESQSAGC